MKNKIKNILMWVLLVFIPPVGIIYMWISKKELKKSIKIILTIIFAAWFIFCLSPAASSDDDVNKSSETTDGEMSKDDASSNQESDSSEDDDQDIQSESDNNTKTSISENILNLPAFTAEPKTNAMVDQIASAARDNADSLTDDQVEQIISEIRTADHKFFSSDEDMEKFMWYGYLLDYKYDDSDVRSELGCDLYQAIKGVYRNTELVTDDHVVENLKQIDKSLEQLQ